MEKELFKSKYQALGEAVSYKSINFQKVTLVTEQYCPEYKMFYYTVFSKEIVIATFVTKRKLRVIHQDLLGFYLK